MPANGRKPLSPHIVTDADGKPTAVQISIEEFRALLDLIEDAADAAVYRKALAEASSFRSLDDVLAEMDESRPA